MRPIELGLGTTLQLVAREKMKIAAYHLLTGAEKSGVKRIC